LEFELEEQRELAASRMQELEKLNQEYLSSVKQIEKYKSDVSCDDFLFLFFFTRPNLVFFFFFFYILNELLFVLFNLKKNISD
jgi:hypothetical protein